MYTSHLERVERLLLLIENAHRRANNHLLERRRNRRVRRVRRRGRRRHARRLAAHCAIRGHVATRVEETRHERSRAHERVSVAGLAAIAVGARVDGSEAGGLT